MSIFMDEAQLKKLESNILKIELKCELIENILCLFQHSTNNDENEKCWLLEKESKGSNTDIYLWEQITNSSLIPYTLLELKRKETELRAQNNHLRAEKNIHLQKIAKESSTIISPNKSAISNVVISEDRNNLNKIITLLIHHKSIPLYVNGCHIAYENINCNLFLNYLEFSDTNHELIKETLGCPNFVFGGSTQTFEMTNHIDQLANYFRDLNTIGETTVQNNQDFKNLMYENAVFYLKDTHSIDSVYNFPTVEYDENSINSNSENVKSIKIKKSGRPDATSRLFPLFVELKGKDSTKYSGLLQSLMRLISQVNMYDIFTRFIAVSPGDKDDSWVVVINNNISNDNVKKLRSLHLLRLQDKNLMASIINQVTLMALSDSSYVFNKDADIIIRTLESLNIHWNHCRINLLNKSSSNVYQVVVGGRKKIKNDDQTFVLKINDNSERYEREIQALKLISAQYKNKIDNSFYGIAHFSSKNNEITFFDENLKTVFMRKKIVLSGKDVDIETCWFSNGRFDSIKPTVEEFAGVLMMYEGKSVENFTMGMYTDIMRSIELTHVAGLLHTDIRPNNYLYFEHSKSHQLIDFDLSVLLPSGCREVNVMLQRSGDRFKKSPLCVKDQVQKESLQNEITVKWNEKCDVLMFTEYYSLK